ncbi:hypothetical protein D9M70_567340 [compost metagenome]
MRGPRTRRQPAETGRRQADRQRVSRQQGRIGIEVGEHQLATAVRSVGSEQTELQADEGHRELSTHRHAEDFTGIRAESGRDIHSQHRQAAGVDPLGRPGIGLTHRAAQTGAEKGIDQHAAQFAIVAPRQHRNAGRQRLGMGRRSVTGKT